MLIIQEEVDQQQKQVNIKNDIQHCLRKMTLETVCSIWKNLLLQKDMIVGFETLCDFNIILYILSLSCILYLDYELNLQVLTFFLLHARSSMLDVQYNVSEE